MEDARAAKDKKMKKVAIGLSVVLVAILAYQVPKLLHSGQSSAAPAATTTTDTTGAPTTGVPTATPTTAPGTAAAALTPASSKLPNSDTLPAVGKGQLFAFNHFTAKDPFVQQVVAQAAAQPASSSGSTSATAPNNPTASQTAKVSQKHSTRVLAVRGAARISVNGRIQVVRVGASFPSANPLFKLVSVTNGVARIGIASGSYSSGARTVSLGAGRTLTLVDTADGIRYQLRLLSR
jgi:hypothetical protein